MKLNDLAQKQNIKSSLNGNTFDAEIKDPKVMMLIVRDKLYSHKLRTPIQEYISNAVDAQVVSKNTQTPIKIVLPTTLEPVLKIRDFGTGMSPQKIKDTFSQYTASDKRESLDLIGGFGLGSKSAFAYTDKFTVVSYYNGEKHSYVAYAPSQLDLVFTHLSSVATSEPNGVEIQIPIKTSDIPKSIEAVTRMAILLPTCPELVNYPGNFKQNIYDQFYNSIVDENDDFCVFNASAMPVAVKLSLNLDQNKYFIRYNNIPYLIANHHTQGFESVQTKAINRFIVMFKAPMNTFQIPPSREMLVEDDRYHSFIKSLSDKVSEWNKQKREIEKQKLDQITCLEEMQKEIKKVLFEFTPFEKNLTFKDQKLPCVVNLNCVAFKIKHNVIEVNRINKHYQYPVKGTKFSTKVKEYHAAKNSEKEVCFLYNPNLDHTLMICNDEPDNISIETINALKNFFKTNNTIDKLILIKEDSPLAFLAKLNVSEIEMSDRVRKLPLYYIYSSQYRYAKDYTLSMGQNHFAAQLTYHYIEVPEGTKEFQLDDWIVSELTKGSDRLVFLPPETVKKIAKRKSFKKVDLDEIKSKDPREKLSKEDLEFVKYMRYCLNEDRGERSFWEFVQIVDSQNIELKNDWITSLKNDIKKYRELEGKYKLSLISTREYSYHTYPEQTVQFNKNLNLFYLKYPLLKNLRSFLNSKDITAVCDYIIAIDQARSTGILKSVPV